MSKVFGASITNTTVMLGKDFVMLVVIAFITAIPVVWYFSHQWLHEYALQGQYRRIDIFTGRNYCSIHCTDNNGFQSIKAATANPVKNVRNE